MVASGLCGALLAIDGLTAGRGLLALLTPVAGATAVMLVTTAVALGAIACATLFPIGLVGARASLPGLSAGAVACALHWGALAGLLTALPLARATLLFALPALGWILPRWAGDNGGLMNALTALDATRYLEGSRASLQFGWGRLADITPIAALALAALLARARPPLGS
jgi:hypothetical protein